MPAAAPPAATGVLLAAGREEGYLAPRAILAITVEAVVLSLGLLV